MAHGDPLFLGITGPKGYTVFSPGPLQTVANGVTYQAFAQGYASDQWQITLRLTNGDTLTQDRDTTAADSAADARARLSKVIPADRIEIVTLTAPATVGSSPLPGGPVAYAVRIKGFDSAAAAHTALDTQVVPAGLAGKVLYTAQDGAPSTGPWNIRVISIAPDSPYALKAVHGADLRTPETLRDQVRLSGALLGVNASEAVPIDQAPNSVYLTPEDGRYTGIPEGVVMEGGNLLSTANDGRSALVLGHGAPVADSARIAEISTAVSVSAGGSSHPVTGIDRVPGYVYGCGMPGLRSADPYRNPGAAWRNAPCTTTDDLVAFRPEWGDSTPPAADPSLPVREVVMDGNWTVTDAHTWLGTAIPAGGRVLQAVGQKAVQWLTDHAPKGATLQPSASVTDQNGASVTAGSPDMLVGGGPALMRDGRIYINARENGILTDAYTASNTLAERMPRTMVGIAKDGTVHLVTVDGRNPDSSVGVTMSEAAAVMQWVGDTDALELGNGGDTAMIIKDTLYNTPMNDWGSAPKTGYERKLTNALVLAPR
ncbi:phosphodiester glycosidase family protein [Streptomyces sp. SP17BM10]|uniref:phosphodiester glycosidase family protein n=1 Tax=Streptomyces sp. SP17BM10 TaxID=3002530 RepID=UPI002E7A39B0|nr:phosphodiester glycosidase family protein [Streptomyces sp. SP17BM10]MEE1782197.1 phosphodiester glycosidase family protein [Streptomyces sp. SP17BM10]